MSVSWTSDEELFERARRELFSAVIGDTLDRLGRGNQFLPPEIQPPRDDMVIVGRAMPVLEADDEDGKAQGSQEVLHRPFGLMLRAPDCRAIDKRTNRYTGTNHGRLDQRSCRPARGRPTNAGGTTG